jgi:hypothetical protein
MAVDRTNVFTEPRDVIASLLKSQITDPKNPSGRRRWIYRIDPDTTSHDFGGYPIIVLAPVDINNEALTLNNCTLDNDMVFEIIIKAEFNDQFARTDVIANDIFVALTDDNAFATYDVNNMFTPTLLSSTPAEETKDENLLATRLMRFSFNNTL